MGDVDPGLGGCGGFFPVLCQASASAEPGEGSLDDPAARDDLEALRRIGAFDDLERPGADAAERAAQLRPGVSAIGEDVAQLRIGVSDRGEHGGRAIAILDIGGVDGQPDQQPDGVDDDMALAPLDLLAGIIAANPARLRRFHGLAVDHAGARAGLTTLQFARRHGEMKADRLQQPAVAPVVEVALYRRGRREVLR